MPMGIEAGLASLSWGADLPIALVLSVAECAAVAAIYRLLLAWEGNLLSRREQQILECVTNRAP